MLLSSSVRSDSVSSAENNYEKIVEGALDFGIMSLDPNRKITTWNR